jgi:hypothetical protein
MDKSGLFMGLGVGLLLSSTISSFVLGSMAKEALDEKRQGTDEALEPVDIIKTVTPYAAPPLVLSVVGTIMILHGNKMNVERGTAYMAAYALSDSALREYREKTREIVGEKKEQQIMDEVDKEIVKKNPCNEIIVAGDGDYLCCDGKTGRYFTSNITKLQHIENLIDRRLIDEEFVSLNELYLEIGLSELENGDNIGWHMSRGYIQMRFSYQGADDGKPCMVMSYREPEPKFI